ncbi:hypothetical protein BGZ81_002439 [Podila clonocystis]|nr:hypothetical protein BGZ81_002439 [Podila clonocystis]
MSIACFRFAALDATTYPIHETSVAGLRWVDKVWAAISDSLATEDDDHPSGQGDRDSRNTMEPFETHFNSDRDNITEWTVTKKSAKRSRAPEISGTENGPKSVLASFHNIMRLIVRAEYDEDGLSYGQSDIDVDVENGSSLEVKGLYNGDAEVAGMIAVIPNLQSVKYFDMGENCFKALAQHCPQLKDVDADWEAQSLIQDSDYDDVLRRRSACC